MPMMGVPFLLLNWRGSAPMIAAVIVIFVLWVALRAANDEEIV